MSNNMLRAIYGVARPNHLVGLTLSNNASDAVNDIDIATGEAGVNDTIGAMMVLTSALTKRLDASWAAGTNQGGLDTGSIANGVYAIWLIGRSDTGAVDALFSISMSAPTMPANYDRKRRIGNILRVSGAIVAFYQNDDRFYWKSGPYLDVNATNPGTSAVTRALTVPAGSGNVIAMLNVQLQVNATESAGSALYISPMAVDDVAPSLTAAPLGQVTLNLAAGNVFASAPVEVLTDSSGQIRTRLAASGPQTVLRIATLGWIDRRGRSG